MPLHPRNNTFASEVVLRLASDALSWCGVSPADPLALEGTRERFLREYAGRGLPPIRCRSMTFPAGGRSAARGR
jgi:hypothetical protein